MTGKRSTFKIGGVSLENGNAWTVTDDQKMHGPQNITRAAVSLPFQRGELAMPRSYAVGAGEWSVTVLYGGNTYQQMLENKGRLEAAMMPALGLVTIQEVFPSATWTTEAQLTAAETDGYWHTSEDYMEVTYTFRIPSGVWWETAQSQTYTTAGTYTHPAAGGSAPKTWANIQLTLSASWASFRIQAPGTEDNGISFYGDDSVSSGVVTIDAENMTARHASGKVLDGMLEPGPVQFYIPVDGTVRITSFSGVSSAAVSLRKTWY